MAFADSLQIHFEYLKTYRFKRVSRNRRGSNTKRSFSSQGIISIAGCVCVLLRSYNKQHPPTPLITTIPPPPRFRSVCKSTDNYDNERASHGRHVTGKSQKEIRLGKTRDSNRSCSFLKTQHRCPCTETKLNTHRSYRTPRSHCNDSRADRKPRHVHCRRGGGVIHRRTRPPRARANGAGCVLRAPVPE